MATLDWSGRTWDIRPASTGSSPGPNDWTDSPTAIYVNDDDELVQRIAYEGGSWKCVECYTQETLGYGRYTWVVNSDLSNLDAMTVVGMFTYGENPIDETDGFVRSNNELDIECSRWTDPDLQHMMQASVHPLGSRGFFGEWIVNNKPPYTCVIEWHPNHIRFKMTDRAGKQLYDKHVYRQRRSRQELTFCNLWLVNGNEPYRGMGTTIKYGSFTFEPF